MRLPRTPKAVSFLSQPMVETNYFTISPQQYVRTAMGVWLGRYGWIGIAIVACFIAAGFHDARFFIVAAAIVLLAYPGIMMLVYFNHALTKEAAYSVIPHKIKIAVDGLEIAYHTDEDRPTPPVQTIRIKEVAKVEDTGKSMRLTLKSGRYEIIEIPSAAFSGDGFAEALQILTKNV